MRVKCILQTAMVGASIVAAVAVSPAVFAGELETLADQVLRADSQRWLFNRYVPGSTRNARIVSRSKAQKSAVVYSEYTLNGDRAGWVKINIENGQLNCLVFFDFPHVCRALGDTPSSRFMNDFAKEMARDITSGGRGGQDSRSQSQQDFDDGLRSFRQNQLENGLAK